MAKSNVTTFEAAGCLGLLKNANGPMVAAEIARVLGLGGKRETQRRHVRAIVKCLRDAGEWIVATLQGGYMVTDDADVWKDYNEGQQIDAKRILGVTGKRKKIIADSAGQGLLFKPMIGYGTD